MILKYIIGYHGFLTILVKMILEVYNYLIKFHTIHKIIIVNYM